MKKVIFILCLAILLQIGITLFTYYNYPDHPMVYHYTVDLNLWFGTFEHIAAHEIPMVDFGIEYPAGTVFLYWLLYLFYFSKTQFLIFHSMFMLGVFIVSLIYLYKLTKLLRISSSTWIMILYVLSPTILMLNHVRFDIVPATLTIAGFYYYKKGKLYLPSILLGLGAAMKWFPAFMVISLAWETLFINKRFLKALKLCIISFLSYLLLDLIFIAASYIQQGNITNWLFSFSANANLIIFTDTIPGLIRIFYGTELPTYLPLYIFGALFLIITIIPYPKDSLSRFILYCFSFLIFNKIYSPQFHIWFLPFLLLCIGQSKYYKFGFFIVILLELVNISIYPFSFSMILEKLGRFELGPLFPILSFKIFTNGIIIRTILLAILSAYIYSPKASIYLSVISAIIFFSVHANLSVKDKLTHKRLAFITKGIPQEAHIAVDKTTYPYLKNKYQTDIFFPKLEPDPDYILLKTFPKVHPLRWNYYKDMLINLLTNSNYVFKKYMHEYVLLQKNISPSEAKNEAVAKHISRRFEAEYMPGAIGITIEDENAQNKLARTAYKNSKSGHLVYGPYVELRPGEYEVSFRLKTTDNTTDQLTAKIDVAGKIGQLIYAEKDIYAKDFKLANRYQLFKIPFTLTSLDKIEFRVFFTGKTDLTIDRINLYPD